MHREQWRKRHIPVLVGQPSVGRWLRRRPIAFSTSCHDRDRTLAAQSHRAVCSDRALHLPSCASTAMECYANIHELARAAQDMNTPKPVPPPDAYLLPPYQMTTNAFLTRSSLLSPPPIQMRAYGMPEYLWCWFEDWFSAPLHARPAVLNKAALGFELRFPGAPVVVKTREQQAWVNTYQRGPPPIMTTVEVRL